MSEETKPSNGQELKQLISYIKTAYSLLHSAIRMRFREYCRLRKHWPIASIHSIANQLSTSQHSPTPMRHQPQ